MEREGREVRLKGREKRENLKGLRGREFTRS